MRIRSVVPALLLVLGGSVVVLITVVYRQAGNRRQPLLPPSSLPFRIVQPPARVAVVVLPVGTTAGDSIRTILQRDLGDGDWLSVLPLDSMSAAAAVLQITPFLTSSATWARVSLIDAATHRVYRWADFPVGDRWSLHGIADEVQQWITGHRGGSQTRLAYVSRGQLHVIDADGANDRVVTHGSIALSPAWRHDGGALVYTELGSWGSRLMELDLQRGARLAFPAVPAGLNITPVYSPDDRWIVFAHGGDGHTALMAVRRDGTAPPSVIVSSDDADNTSPTFRPDGRRIAFMSGHSTTPQIYSIRMDGTGERLETPIPSRRRSYQASPDWSPDGRTIVFEQQNEVFQIWTVTLQDHTMHQLTFLGQNGTPHGLPMGGIWPSHLPGERIGRSGS